MAGKRALRRPRRGRIVFAAGLAAALIAGGLVHYLSGDSNDASVTATPVAPAVPVADVEQPALGNSTDLASGAETNIKGDRLVVDSVGINAPIDDAAVVIGAEGPEMDVPDDVSRVAWLNTGAHPGDLVGASVISGHVSDTSDRPGAMWNLKDTEVGDLIEWVSGGRKWTYVVTGHATYPRSGSLPSELFDNSSERTLFLVTCHNRKDLGGGRFTYPDNLVVKAELYGVIESGIPLNG